LFYDACLSNVEYKPGTTNYALFHHDCYSVLADTDLIAFILTLRPGPSPGFSSKGGQKPGGAKNQKRGPHFKNTVLDVCSNQGAKCEIGGHRFQMGRPGTTGPPAGNDPD